MKRFAKVTAILALAGLGCAAQGQGPLTLDDVDVTKADPLKADTSAEAVFLDFSFDGELVTSSRWGAEQQIEDQLLYTIGHLNGNNSIGRLDRVELSDVQTTPTDDGRYLVSYHAKLPVAWGNRSSIPTEYTFSLPRDMTQAGLSRFFDTYATTCVDPHAHDNEVGIYWYYYRTNGSCSFNDGDVMKSVADVSQSPVQTTGMFPEYDQVWKDDALRVVAIFGKYEDGATSGDAGINGYNNFVREIRRTLERVDADIQTTPASVPSSPGTSVPEVTFSATLAGGKSVEVVAILVDNVRTAGADFDRRYAELSTNADFITYNGHAGLGANIRALAQKGRWTAGQYAIVFMNGCDTFAYVDSALWDAHSRVNGGEPGTKTCDIVMNAMPSFFSSMPYATMAIFNALLHPESPKTYEQIFADVDDDQVVLVSGEQDNVFTPGGGDPEDPPPPAWGGMSESGTVARNDEKRFETPALPAGSYRFEMTGTSDADLYVRIGSAPTQTEYDCRPYKGSSNETCDVTLAAPAAIHVMVRGYAASSDFSLTGGAR